MIWDTILVQKHWELNWLLKANSEWYIWNPPLGPLQYYKLILRTFLNYPLLHTDTTNHADWCPVPRLTVAVLVWYCLKSIRPFCSLNPWNHFFFKIPVIHCCIKYPQILQVKTLLQLCFRNKNLFTYLYFFNPLPMNQFKSQVYLWIPVDMAEILRPF